ncbi:PadR family transcriptional regulator [Leptolyngbya sp. FACHB-711]|nr:PadR family transcriptional regulator [Leptolyngbya sp. FACHB-711]
MGNLELKFRDLKLTFLEEVILLTILDEARYGQSIVEAVSAASGGSCQLNPGTLYPALQRLQDRGLIQIQHVQKNVAVRNGHCRRYYQATSKGKEAITEMEKIRSYIRSPNGVTQVSF